MLLAPARIQSYETTEGFELNSDSSSLMSYRAFVCYLFATEGVFGTRDLIIIFHIKMYARQILSSFHLMNFVNAMCLKSKVIILKSIKLKIDQTSCNVHGSPK